MALRSRRVPPEVARLDMPLPRFDRIVDLDHPPVALLWIAHNPLLLSRCQASHLEILYRREPSNNSEGMPSLRQRRTVRVLFKPKCRATAFRRPMAPTR